MTISAPAPVEPFRVLRVVDTRVYEEVGERWVAQRGTGVERECDRCGRRHEVHAEVLDAQGREWVVGVGCAVAQGEARKLQARATREARERAAAEAKAEARERVAGLRAGLVAFDAGRVERGVDEARVAAGREARLVWRYEDASVWGWDLGDDAERVDCLRGVWERNRLAEMVGGHDELRRLLARADVWL